MERKEFISTLGFSVAACACGALVSCSKSSDNPGSGGGGVVIDDPLEIDLSTTLLSVGSSVTRDGVIVVRLADTNEPASFTALSVACTHQGTFVNYSSGSKIFICPNHGSEFSTSGSVLQGPATKPLKKFQVSISGSTLTVS